MYISYVKSFITKFVTTLLCCFLSISCNHETKKAVKAPIISPKAGIVSKINQNRDDTTTAIMIDTLYGSWDSLIFKKIKYFVKSPAITSLPFGYTGNSKTFTVINKFYSDLLAKDCYVGGQVCDETKLKNIKIYKLPLIKKINYISTGDRGDPDTCEGGKSFGMYLKINKYRYRLPDVNNYQYYYWCDYKYHNQLYTDAISVKCDWCIKSFYFGYLIFYDPKTYTAKVINIYLDTFEDGSAVYRHFFIDKDYTIHISDFSAPSDDEGDDISHPYGGEDIIIKVLKDGNIVVKPAKVNI